MNYNFAHRLAEIIIKTWLNIASDDERETLLVWLDENEENRQTYKSIIKGDTLKRRLKSEESILNASDFNLICRDITQTLLKRRRNKRVAHALFYATGAVVLFLTAWLFWPANESDTEYMADEQSKVKLITSLGNVMSLDRGNLDSIDVATAIIVKDGEGISYLSKSEDKKITDIEVRHKIVTDVGGEYSFVLSDGTKVWINSESEIEFPVNFISNQRVINLIGEAYFEVEHDPDRPFIVHSLNQSVEVLGTSFNIKAYENDYRVYTTLVEGEVSVGSGGNKVILKPGMESICTKDDNGIEVRNVNTDFSTSWKLGYFMFNDESLEEILKVLRRWYGYEMIYQEKIDGSNTFSGRFEKYTDLESTLNAITLAGGPKFLVNSLEKRVIISK